MNSQPTSPKRPYRSTRRQQQAERTRGDVLAAAVGLFRDRGWSGTKVADVAAAADVAVETVYAGFRSKKGLLRAAMDVAVVGDAEPVAFAERPEARRLAEGSFDDRLAAAATVTADIHARSIGVWQAILEAAAGDPEVDGWRADLEAGRRVEIHRSVEAIAGGAVDEVVVDAVWALLGPETYRKLTADRSMDRAAYEAFVREVLRRLLS